MTTLIPVLGDQLSPRLSALRGAAKAEVVVLMAEVEEEAGYVPHHRKKMAFLFAAMRHHAERLRRDGWRVDYVRLDDPGNAGGLTGEVGRALARHGAGRIVVTEPGEHRLLAAFGGWEAAFGVPVELREDDRFLCSKSEFAAWAEERSQLRMEWFYREMRRKTGLLMDGREPAGGRWNFDAENRKPAADGLFLPAPFDPGPDAVVDETIALVERRFPDRFGDLRPFRFPVSPEGAEAALEKFLKDGLPRFGDHQDAMLRGRPFLWHSVLSPCLNAGLLDPLDLCRRVEAEWRAGRAPLNAAEGFIRQILGWREYVRGVYWLRGPDYLNSNVFGAARPLPAFYWTGETDMACLADAVGQTRREAYAHHIQRLMLTGNFALLAGIDPFAVHEWYLSVYADAYEWVEAPNTLGMALYADGGLLASKPYAASGAYIDRMSDHCGACRFDVKKKTGPDACPFNALYWDFLARNEARLRGNPRLGPVWKTWERMAPEAQAALRASAAAFLDRLA